MKKIVMLAFAALLVVVAAAGASAHYTPTVEMVTKAANGGWSCDDGIKVEPVAVRKLARTVSTPFSH